MDKTAEIKNFIGVYDNYIMPEECDKVIKFFEEQNKFNKTLTRIQMENSPISQKQDRHYFAEASTLDTWWADFRVLIMNFDLAWNHYLKHTGANEAYDGGPFHYTTLKVQKTSPTEGYHIWHIEHGKSPSDAYRAFVFTIYLNDVEEGGETEFLHYSQRVKPKKGRIVIWPSAFPYLHRGNPPLSGDKYILTSWLDLK